MPGTEVSVLVAPWCFAGAPDFHSKLDILCSKQAVNTLLERGQPLG